MNTLTSVAAILTGIAAAALGAYFAATGMLPAAMLCYVVAGGFAAVGILGAA